LPTSLMADQYVKQCRTTRTVVECYF